MQREIDALRAELSMLRRRDDTLNLYMHRLDEELRLAARLQQDFLPKTLPAARHGAVPHAVPPRRVRQRRPVRRRCGSTSGTSGFYMADAVGHGMPAALLTMFLKHALVTKDIAPPPTGLPRSSSAGRRRCGG